VEEPRLNGKYGHILQRLVNLRSVDYLGGRDRAIFQEELERYNRRYFGGDTSRYFSLEQYVSLSIKEVYHQLENIGLEEARVGDKPYAKEFYENAPLVEGLEKADEIVLILDSPIGDAVLTVPLLVSLEKYLKLQNASKPVKIVTLQPGLFKSLEQQFPGSVEIIHEADAKRYFEAADKKNRFVFNTHKSFSDYGLVGLNAQEASDPLRVLSVDYSWWQREMAPIGNGKWKKYDAIPARISRNFEIMVGTKLFDDINEVDSFIDRDKDFETKSAALKDKYQIEEGERVVVVSFGTSIQPKEYHPDRWNQVIAGICRDHPEVHVLILEDPSQERMGRYAPMLQKLKADNPDFKVSVVSEARDLSNMNTIMSMADLSITPDTGLGHYSAALGTPNVMLTMVNPVQWSAAKTIRVMHPNAIEMYRLGKATYDKAWNPKSIRGYYVDGGVDKDGSPILTGVSDIDPQEIIKQVEGTLFPKGPKKRESKETIKLTDTVKNGFQENPFKFFYSADALDAKKNKLAPEQVVRGLFEANGLGDQYEQAKLDAPKVKNASGPQRFLIQLLKLMAQKNPGLRQEWQKEHPRNYEVWSIQAAIPDINKDLASAQGLTDTRIDEYAREAGIPAMKFVERVLAAKASWQKKAEKEFEAAGSPAGQKEAIYRRVLREAQQKRSSRPSSSRPARGRPPVSRRGERTETGPLPMEEPPRVDLRELANLLNSLDSGASKRTGSRTKKKPRKK